MEIIFFYVGKKNCYNISFCLRCGRCVLIVSMYEKNGWKLLFYEILSIVVLGSDFIGC